MDRTRIMIWRIGGPILLFAVCLMSSAGRMAAQPMVSFQTAYAAPDSGQATNAAFSREFPSSDAPEIANQDSALEILIKRVSQYRPDWLKGWAFPTWLVLTCAGVLVLLAGCPRALD